MAIQAFSANTDDRALLELKILNWPIRLFAYSDFVITQSVQFVKLIQVLNTFALT